MRAAHVYIIWRDTTPVYVGCTIDLARRMREHRRDTGHAIGATHISAIRFNDVEEALRAEVHYIQKLRPRNNVQGNPARHSLGDALAWLEYDALWFSEQPAWMQELVNRWLDIGPVEAVERRRSALRDLRSVA